MPAKNWFYKNKKKEQYGEVQFEKGLQRRLASLQHTILQLTPLNYIMKMTVHIGVTFIYIDDLRVPDSAPCNFRSLAEWINAWCCVDNDEDDALDDSIQKPRSTN